MSTLRVSIIAFVDRDLSITSYDRGVNLSRGSRDDPPDFHDELRTRRFLTIAGSAPFPWKTHAQKGF